MKQFLLSAGVFLLSGLVPIAAVARQPDFDEVYVFGDSLSDTGNVYQATNGQAPPSPPYFDGRYSNGPVWVEYLADELDLADAELKDFAFGGATTGRTNNTSAAGMIGLQQQIDRFIATNPDPDPDALYIIWAGANDYLGGTVTNPSEPLANLSQAITDLADAGAQTILVANLPDLGEIPLTRYTERSTSLSSLSQQHNAQLAELIDRLQPRLAPDVNLLLLDVNSLFADAIANPDRYGFSDVNSSCLEIRCPNPDGYLFWDQLHPSTAAHEQLAELAIETLEEPSDSANQWIRPEAMAGIVVVGALTSVAWLRLKP
jgi:thermolabile hemolysin